MKKIILSVFIFAAACEQHSSFPWVQGPLPSILERAQKEYVLVDFETDWCKWCKVLDEKTYPDPQVIKFARKHLVGFKIDAEKGAGIALAQKYNIEGFPTLVIMDNNGLEVDRIIGYYPPPQFLEELKRITNGIETIKAYELEAENSPGQELPLSNLAEKYETAGYSEKAVKLWQEVRDLDQELKSKAEFRLAIIKFKNDKSIENVEKYLSSAPDHVYTQQILTTVARHFKKEKNREMEILYLLKNINNAEINNLETASLLNGFSWRITELEAASEYELALEKAQKAISLVAEEDSEIVVGIMDTKAEVLWKMNRIDEAVAVINEALVLSPDDEYLTGQKKKFLQY